MWLDTKRERMTMDAQGCLGLLKLLIHRSGYSHVCSGLKVEMELGEVKIQVWMLWYPGMPERIIMG